MTFLLHVQIRVPSKDQDPYPPTREILRLYLGFQDFFLKHPESFLIFLSSITVGPEFLVSRLYNK